MPTGDKTAYEISRAFEAIENELTASMIRNLKKHTVEEVKEGKEWAQWQVVQLRELEKYRKVNKKKFGKEFTKINSRIDAMIRAAEENGRADQEKAILEAIKSGKFPAARRHRKSVEAGADFFNLNEKKLEALLDATQNDFKSAEHAILRRANDQYRKIIFNAQVYANTGAGTYEKAVDMATKDFLTAGINCIEYKNGSRHTMRDYSSMALRTASKRAYLMGEGAKRNEWGIHTVIAAKRGNPCPKCAPWCGRVMIDDVYAGGSAKDGKYPLLSTAISAGFLHPNCKDSYTTYFPDVTQEGRPWTQEELKELKINAEAEAAIKTAKGKTITYKKLAQNSLDPENKRKYTALSNIWAKKLKLKQATPEVIAWAKKGFSNVPLTESLTGGVNSGIYEEMLSQMEDVSDVILSTYKGSAEFGGKIKIKAGAAGTKDFAKIASDLSGDAAILRIEGGTQAFDLSKIIPGNTTYVLKDGELTIKKIEQVKVNEKNYKIIYATHDPEMSVEDLIYGVENAEELGITGESLEQLQDAAIKKLDSEIDDALNIQKKISKKQLFTTTADVESEFAEMNKAKELVKETNAFKKGYEKVYGSAFGGNIPQVTDAKWLESDAKGAVHNGKITASQYNTIKKHTDAIQGLYSLGLADADALLKKWTPAKIKRQSDKQNKLLANVAKIEHYTDIKNDIKVAQIDAKLDAENAKLNILKAAATKATSTKKYSNLWPNDVTVNDWPIKAGINGGDNSIKKKTVWLSDQINLHPTSPKVATWQQQLDDLKQFNDDGKAWYNSSEQIALRDVESRIKQLTDEKNAITGTSNGFFPQERLDNAKSWTRIQKNVADKYFDPVGKRVYASMDSGETTAVYDYTKGSGPFNRPLAGFRMPGLHSGKWDTNYKVGVNMVDINWERQGDGIRNFTNLISRSTYPDDVWLQSGQKEATIESFLGIPYNSLKNMTDTEINNLSQQFEGFGDYMPQFLSASIVQGGGSMFDSYPTKWNIFAPSGSEMLYCVDGTYGKGEDEIFLQRGGYMKIRRIYRGKNKYSGKKETYIDVEIHPEKGYYKFQQDPSDTTFTGKHEHL